MVLMGGFDIPIKAVREYICSAIDLIVNIERMSDGRRKVTSISEIEKFTGGEIKLKEIFAFEQDGLTDSGAVNGEFILYEGVPRIYQKIKARGITDIDDIFFPEVEEIKQKKMQKNNEEKKEVEVKKDKEIYYYKGKYSDLIPDREE